MKIKHNLLDKPIAVLSIWGIFSLGIVILITIIILAHCLKEITIKIAINLNKLKEIGN